MQNESNVYSSWLNNFVLLIRKLCVWLNSFNFKAKQKCQLRQHRRIPTEKVNASVTKYTELLTFKELFDFLSEMLERSSFCRTRLFWNDIFRAFINIFTPAMRAYLVGTIFNIVLWLLITISWHGTCEVILYNLSCSRRYRITPSERDSDELR